MKAYYVDMAKLADAIDLGSIAARHAGSIPVIHTSRLVNVVKLDRYELPESCG